MKVILTATVFLVLGGQMREAPPALTIQGGLLRIPVDLGSIVENPHALPTPALPAQVGSLQGDGFSLLQELEFSNMAAHPLDPDMEIYTKDLGGKLELSLMEKKEQQQIWETTVRPGDVRLPGSTPTQAGNIEDKMTETWRDALQETLDELEGKNIKRFKSKLNHMELPEGYKRIPNGMLEEADSLTVCELLVQYYTMDGAVEVAIQVLKGINQNELAGKLETHTRRIPAGIDSVCSRFSAMELGSAF